MTDTVAEAEIRNLVEAAMRALFEHRSFTAIDALLRDDVRLKPPTYWKAWTGADAVKRLLVFAAVNIDALNYTHIYWSDRHAAFQFTARIGDLELSGVDLVTLDGEGRIAEIEIVARPPKAIALLGIRMGASVAADPFFSAPAG